MESDPLLTPLVSEGERGPEEVNEGTRLGKYEMLKRLSVGGMAEIFLARAAGLPGFKKLVVVKRILPELAARSEFIDMFLDEARLAATLQHANVVQTYDVDVARGNYFMAMEYLHGEDLNTLLRAMKKRKQRVPLEHAVHIAISLLAGLHYAHEKEDDDGKPLEIVHRDVTPSNVIVTYEGSVKLLDFGIAHAAQSAQSAERSGSVKGKVGYMSPEQAQALPLDRRTDIFSAGILLWELTLVRRLYKGETDYQVLNNIVNGVIQRPSSIDPDYDPELEKIVMRALARDPAERYPTAQAMQQDLESLARRRGLFLSPSSLKEWMASLFGKRIDAWRQAQAEGKPIPEEMVIAYEDDDDPSGAVALETAAPRSGRRLRAAIIAAASVVAATALAGGVLLSRHPAVKPPAPRPAVVEVAPPEVVPVVAAVPAPAAPVLAEASGVLSLLTHPRGATLYLDGKKLDALSNTTLTAAVGREHTLTVEKHGFQLAQRKFSVEAGGTRKLVVELRAEAPAPAAARAPVAAPPVVMKGQGVLALTSSPWCSVAVDGNDRGQTPLRLDLGAGTHQVVLSNPEYHIKRQISVTVHPGETVRKSLEFTR